MTASSSTLTPFHPFDWRVFAAALVFVLLGSVMAIAQISVSEVEKTMTVDDAPDMEVFALGKSVRVKGQAKGVLAFGGDVIVEGRVYGDVASFGGQVIQKEGAYIGGDIFVFGGKYIAEGETPLREAGRETVMIAGYEEELRSIGQDPTSLVSPSLSVAFIAQRLLSVLFWFVVSLVFATIAPGAVSRATARFQLSTLKVIGIGAAAFLITTIAVIASVSVLPNYISAIVGVMGFVLLMLAYLFGRVALHVSVGKALQKYFFGEGNRSEALSIVFGVLFWTLLLSIPYVWTLALFILFSAGIGLVLTARPPANWQVR